MCRYPGDTLALLDALGYEEKHMTIWELRTDSLPGAQLDTERERSWTPVLQMPATTVHRLVWGHSLKCEWPHAAVANSVEAFPIDDFPDGGATLFVSDRVARIIQKLDSSSSEFLCVDMYVRDRPLFTKQRYWVWNILRVTPCINDSRSEVEPAPSNQEFLSRFPPDKKWYVRRKTFLNRNAIPPNAHCFRAAPEYLSVFVSEHLRRAIESVGATGCRFEPVRM